MIREHYVGIEVAKLAKEKGFSVPVYGMFEPINETTTSLRGSNKSTCANWNVEPEWYSMPTQALLQAWLREKHEIIVVPTIFDKGFLEKNKFCYQYHIYNKMDTDETTLVSNSEWKTWEEALEEGLKSGLELIK